MVPSNIVGPTDTLRDLIDCVQSTRSHLCNSTRDPSLHAYCLEAFAKITRRIETAARTIDAVQVQLAEARGLILNQQQCQNTPLTDVQKVELAQRIATQCGFELPRYYPYKSLEEAMAAMGITVADLDTTYHVDTTPDPTSDTEHTQEHS